MAYVETGDSIADDTVVLRELKASPLNKAEFDSSLQVIVDALNDLNTRVITASSVFDLPETAETLASEVLALSNDYPQNCIVDTEGGAATDTLSRITGLTEALVILIQATSASRVITVEHGTYLRLASGRSFILNSAYDSIFLRMGASGVCTEISRSSNQ